MEKKLISDLGGAQAVADYLGVARNAVANWQLEGRSIPWKRRHAIARMAAERGVSLPQSFWGEQAA